MKLGLLFLMFVTVKCLGHRLTPLENNDKLEHIEKLYIAEWQWESWPVKQDLAEQEGRSLGQRKNFALWSENSKSAWYLFGGQSIDGNPTKVYSDVWKFTVKTRVWKKFLPSQSKMKNVYTLPKGESSTPQSDFVDEGNNSFFEPAIHKTVLCGGLKKKNSTSEKSKDLWSNYRRKKLEEEKPVELSYLGVYAQKGSKSNAIWLIDVKEKIWSSNFCCCEKENKALYSRKPLISKTNETSIKKTDFVNATKNKCVLFDSQINNAEDLVDNEQQHLTISDLKNKKKKINQFKKANDNLLSKVIKSEKRESGRKEKDVNETKNSLALDSSAYNTNTFESVNNSGTDVKIKKKDYDIKPVTASQHLGRELKVQKLEKVAKPKATSKFCPKLADDGTHLTWCDAKNEAFVTADVGSNLITLWVYDLKKRKWSHVEVKDCDKTEWSTCAINSIRYAGSDESVYIICSPSEKTTDRLKTFLNLTNPSRSPSESIFNTKLIFKINYEERVLQSFGKIHLNYYFNLPEGKKAWQNESLTVLKVFKTSENETILILAYLDIIDLWILSKNQEGEEGFELIEKIWRGSALKWFDKYNAILYSLQFVSESGTSDTILLPNPRILRPTDYWPRERGRFIIRIFKNENIKNQSFENRTREHNLTYELLQSDYRPSGSEHHYNQMYSLKVVVFFGISLTIFTIFGFVVFLKKCVNCPPRIRIRNEYHKSPMVIRYSVIPDDLLYPVT